MDFVEVFQNKLKKLNEDNSYVLIDMNLTPEEQEILKKFDIKTTKEKNYHTVDTNYKEKIMNQLELIGNNNQEQIEILYNLINRIINDVINGYKAEDAIIDIRFALPNNDYIIPRWHYDGAFFGHRGILESKFVMTLIGDGTLICKCSQDVRQEFIKLFEAQTPDNRDNIDNRKILNDFLLSASEDGTADIKQIKENCGCGCVFILENKNIEALHSEPNITKPRLYISIVADSNENIKKRKNVQDEYNRLVKLGDKDKLNAFIYGPIHKYT